MKLIKFDRNPDVFNKEGVFSYVTLDWDASIYGKRSNKFPLGLKIFRDEFKQVESFKWKTVNFLDATKIQNLFWFHGLAPRIYDVVEVDLPIGRRLAQVTEVLPEKERGQMAKELGEKIDIIRKVYGIGRTSIDPNPNHKYKHYQVDFSHEHFYDDTYKNKIAKELVTDAGWGSNPATYQSVPELGVKGQRSLSQRLEAYQWDSINFEGKSVLDYGCSSGQISRECLRRGARYVVGLELPAPAKVAFEVSNYLGYFNIDYYGDNFRHDGQDIYQKIKDYTKEDKFDIVLYLSVMQLWKPDYLRDIVGEYFFLEGHTADKDETFRPWLEEHFKVVEFIGASRDHSIRPVFRCQTTHS